MRAAFSTNQSLSLPQKIGGLPLDIPGSVIHLSSSDDNCRVGKFSLFHQISTELYCAITKSNHGLSIAFSSAFKKGQNIYIHINWSEVLAEL